MSPEERQLLSSLFDRVRSAAGSQRDTEAEAFINQSIREQPYAPYFLSQAVVVQEQGMKAAADRIQQLEARVRELEQQAADHPQQSQGGGSFLGGLGSIFGGGQQQRAPAPQPDYSQQQPRGYDNYSRGQQPQQSAGPWGQQQPSGPWNPQPSAPSAGGSFLRGALGTAAGVAGGVMLAESLSSLFSPHLGGTAAAGSGIGSLFGTSAEAAEQPPVQETIVNNNYFGNDDNSDQNDQRAADYAQDAVQDAQDDDDDYDDSADNSDDSSFV
ncbi:MAG: DUF2076 domain-containing protein [Rhizobiaceae bacterium]|nr:DUF2076 domain-containing protein [Rhizobiaceae bacterium]